VAEQGGARQRASARGGKGRFIGARDGFIVASTRAEEGGDHRQQHRSATGAARAGAVRRDGDAARGVHGLRAASE
jgi:hypothetical protein